MKPSRFVIDDLARAALLAMTAFTLVVAVRVLGEPPRSSRVRSFQVAASEEEHEGIELPPGHPPIGDCLRLPPGHPPVERGARSIPLFPQDGTSTL